MGKCTKYWGINSKGTDTPTPSAKEIKNITPEDVKNKKKTQSNGSWPWLLISNEFA